MAACHSTSVSGVQWGLPAALLGITGPSLGSGPNEHLLHMCATAPRALGCGLGPPFAVPTPQPHKMLCKRLVAYVLREQVRWYLFDTGTACILQL